MVFKVVFRMETPVILNNPIHLDALLSFVHPAMHNQKTHLSRYTQEEIITAPLPIDSAKIANTWVWCCSASEFDDNAKPFTDKFNKRKDYMDYHYLKTRQTPRTGIHRDRLETIYGVVCEHVHFKVSASKENKLSRLLKKVTHLGALRKLGYGQVREFDLYQLPDADWQDCLVNDGLSTRSLPVNMLDEYEEQSALNLRINPPYWLPHGTVDALPPGEKCALKQGVWLNAAKSN